MTELFACFGMWLGMCGSIQTAHFDSEAQCKEALAEVKKADGLKFAYCRPPQQTSKRT